MNVKNCKFCNSIFRYPGFGEVICENCKNKYTIDIKNIKEYLENNPYADAREVSKELEIPLKRILYYIEQGSIILKSFKESKNCPRCGKMIEYKERYCELCKNELIRGFSSKKPIEERKIQKEKYYSRF